MKALEMYGKTIKEIDGFARQLDESIRLEAFKFLLDQELKQDSKSSGTAGVKSASEHGRELSAQELIRSCRVASLMDKALVLAYWLEEHQKKESFSSIDLKGAFTSAREPAPANSSDVVAKLEHAGKVMKAEKAVKAQNYRLTTTGIQDVERWLSGEENAGSEK